MERDLNYLALLGNVDRSILPLQIGGGFELQEWERYEFINIHRQFFDLPWDEVELRLDSNYGYGYLRSKRPKHVYVIVRSFEWSHPLSSRGEAAKPSSSEPSKLFENHGLMWKEAAHIQAQLRKLRLFTEGGIKISLEVFYTQERSGFVMESSQDSIRPAKEYLYRLPKRDVRRLNAMLCDPPIESKHKYIALALENFEQSYEIEESYLEFLALMIAMESLFNDGRTELRYKLARGCAVLLAESEAEGKTIFKIMQSLYDLRSTLVHTGDKEKISSMNVLTLRSLVRRSLAITLRLNISKDALSDLFLTNGFGTLPRWDSNKLHRTCSKQRASERSR